MSFNPTTTTQFHFSSSPLDRGRASRWLFLPQPCLLYPIPHPSAKVTKTSPKHPQPSNSSFLAYPSRCLFHYDVRYKCQVASCSRGGQAICMGESSNTNLSHMARPFGKSQEKPRRKTKVESSVQASEAEAQFRGAEPEPISSPS